jgi:hypothetical protein
MGEPANDPQTISKIYDMLKGKEAPAHVGRPIWEKHLDEIKRLGAVTPAQWFGLKTEAGDERTVAAPLNYGSRKSMGVKGNYNGMGMLETVSDETRLLMFNMKKAINNMEIQAQMKGHTLHPTPELMQSTPAYKNMVAPMLKAFNVTDFSDWIMTIHSRFYFEEYEIAYILADTFDSLPMDSSLVRVPGALGLLEGELEADDATFTIQSNTQASYIVESKNNVVHSQITQDLLDDSSPAIIDKYRKEIMKGSVRSYERALLDGDSSGTHIDDDTQAGSAKLFTKAFNGLRKRAFDNEVTVGGSEIVFAHADTPSKDMFSGLLKRMKCQGADKNDLAYIIGCTTAHDLVTGAIPELFTAFAFGGLASNVTGDVPPVFGIKPVESQLVREDLETDGKADNPTVATTTYALCVQKSRFMNWIRQATRIFASPSLPSSDIMLMTGKTRHAFGGTPQSATERSVVMAIDVKTA